MIKRGKLRRKRGNKRKGLKRELLDNFNKMIKNNNRKKAILGTVIVSVLSLSCVGYFQGKSVFASNKGVYKSLEISKEAEKINTVTPYDKLTDGEEIKILFLGDESYLGDVVLEEDLTTFIENAYNSKVNLTNLSVDKASIYEQLNRYLNIEDRDFDLVFLCFENNDEREVSKTNFSGIYESILRDLKYNNTSVDIIPIIKHETLVSDTYYQIINGLSKYYDLELAKVNEDVSNNNVEGEAIEDFRENYSNTLEGIIKNNVETKKEIDSEYKDVYYGVTTLFEPYKVTVKGEKKKGFSVSQNRAKSSDENDYIRYKVEGNIVGLGYETSVNGGIIEVYVNRVLYRRIDTKSDTEEFKYILISSNLSGTNEIKIVNSDGGDVTLLGVIISGNNTDAKEVEGLNNILARNKGNYSGQVKDYSLYEDAEVEEKKEVAEVQKTESTAKKSENTSSSQSKANTIAGSESKENSNLSGSSVLQGTESTQNNNEGSSGVIESNKNQQSVGNILDNNGGNNSLGSENSTSDNIGSNIQNNGGDINNEINNGVNNSNNSIYNGGNNSSNNQNNSLNNGEDTVNNGGDSENKNLWDNGNVSNNIENNTNRGEVSENTANSFQSSESINSVENTMESIPLE